MRSTQFMKLHHSLQPRLRPYWNLLERWDFQCVVCGYGFTNLMCVTKEHVVPRSMQGKTQAGGEVYAPSHYRCNQLRKTDSLLKAFRRIELRKKSMKNEEFVRWLNVPVHSRTLLDKVQTYNDVKLINRPGFMELPETLPGMMGRASRR